MRRDESRRCEWYVNDTDKCAQLATCVLVFTDKGSGQEFSRAHSCATCAAREERDTRTTVTERIENACQAQSHSESGARSSFTHGKLLPIAECYWFGTERTLCVAIEMADMFQSRFILSAGMPDSVRFHLSSQLATR